MTRALPPVPAGRRRVTAAAAVSVLGFVAAVVASVVLVPAGTAAATSYRFWTYWTKDPSWTFASVGAGRVPADGSVEGWRFSVSPAASSSKPPRSAASFDEVCAGTPAVSGSKRVALVLDYGTSTDAPAGEAPPATVVTHCSVVAPDATGYDVLAAATTLRVEQGLVCGISGYPARGCGDPVADQPSSSPTPTHRPSSDPAPARSGAAVPAEGSAPATSGGSGPQHPRSADAGAGGTARPTDARTPPPTADPATSPAAAVATLPPPTGGGPGPVGAVVGVGVVTVLGVAAWLVARRRRGEPQ